jgi:peptide/nickel transport system substrate-binding protein/oligopeptide transport system substrate-binding protein
LFILSCSHENRLKGCVYYRLNANPSTLDPALIVDVTGGTISAKLFNGLVRLDENLNIIPDIAYKWIVAKDGLTYTFYIRRGITFSNNRQVTANDFKYSFKRILDPETRSPNTWVLEKIAGAREFMEASSSDVSGIKVIDDHTLRIRLEKPFSPFLYLLSMSAAYVVPEEEVRRWGSDFSSHPVGTGPFILEEWLQNRELRLEKRNGYFDHRAQVKGLVYRIIPEDLTVLTEFELGNLDIMAIPASAFAKYRNNAKWQSLITEVRGLNTYYLGMNCSRPPFNNRNLRKAMNLAIDRRKLLTSFYENRGRLAVGPVPDILRKWDAPEAYEYNPEKAGEIVREEGLTGVSISLYITAEQEVVDMAEFIQAYLKKVGLDVRIKQLEWSAYKEAVNKGEADMFWLSWWADYPDPENFLFPLFHSSNFGSAGNRARYRNPEVDRLIELGQAARHEKEIRKYYEQAERRIVDDAPWVFFWHKTDYMLRQPWIKGYQIYPIYSMDKGTDIAINDGQK